MREVFLVGVGATTFGRSGRLGDELAGEAVTAALADAGLRLDDVAACAVATGRAGAQDAARITAACPRPLTAHASAAEAFQDGWRAVAAGEHDVVLCVGADALGADALRDGALTAHAAAAQRYMTMSGATVDHFARVVAKNRAQGADNPRALLADPVRAADVLHSELLAWPLRRLMVAPVADGAAAVVLAARDVRPGSRGQRVRSSVMLADGDGAAVNGAVARAALLAYEAAGAGPEDVDCAEVDDLTAAGEIAAYEALQFAPEGQGPELVDSGFTARGGVLPVNTSGGLLSQGEAGGASGLAQLCELAWQLRGEAGRRQVAGARLGLALSRARDAAGAQHVSLTVLGS